MRRQKGQGDERILYAYESIAVCMSTSNASWRDAGGDLLTKIRSSSTSSLRFVLLQLAH